MGDGRLGTKAEFCFVFFILLISMIGMTPKICKVRASGTIYIRADGSIDHPTANITTADNITYNFTDNNYDEIVVERDNIVIDGVGYTLEGPGAGIGIDLPDRSNVTITNVWIEDFSTGVYLNNSLQCHIIANSITGNADRGIWLAYSSYNSIVGNLVRNNGKGIQVYDYSDFNTITNNDISLSDIAVDFQRSRNCSISENLITVLMYHGIHIHDWSHFNTITGNNISGPDRGISLHHSSNCSISKNLIIAPGVYGISVYWDSNNNSVSVNHISAAGDEGIRLSGVRNNTINGNSVSESVTGIHLSYSDNNNIYENNIRNNDCGIELSGSGSLNNTICHNNFVNNTSQADSFISNNTWDNGFEGNYWSNYTGADSNLDGIGDTPHIISANNTDHYPLMGAFHSFNTTRGKYVNVISNSTVDSFRYFESNSTIIMRVSNITVNQTHGFCRISIPYEVMSEPFTVTIDGADPTHWNYTLYDNGESRWIYFEYAHSTREVVIIPEFSSLIILPLFLMATLLATVFYRRKLRM